MGGRRSGDYQHSAPTVARPRESHGKQRKSTELVIQMPAAPPTPSPCGSKGHDLGTSPPACGRVSPGSGPSSLTRKSLDRARPPGRAGSAERSQSLPTWPGDEPNPPRAIGDLASVLPCVVDSLTLETRKALRSVCQELCGYVGGFFTALRRHPHLAPPKGLAQRFPNLRSLQLQGGEDLTDAQLADALSALSQLAEVDISQCTGLSTSTLAALAGLPALRRLTFRLDPDLGRVRSADEEGVAVLCRMKYAMHTLAAMPRLQVSELMKYHREEWRAACCLLLLICCPESCCLIQRCSRLGEGKETSYLTRLVRLIPLLHPPC